MCQLIYYHVTTWQTIQFGDSNYFPKILLSHKKITMTCKFSCVPASLYQFVCGNKRHNTVVTFTLCPLPFWYLFLLRISLSSSSDSLSWSECRSLKDWCTVWIYRENHRLIQNTKYHTEAKQTKNLAIVAFAVMPIYCSYCGKDSQK